MIAIESRTQGDHEELMIFLHKHLILSLFNQKLSLRKRENIDLQSFITKFRAVQFAEGALDGCNCMKLMGHDPHDADSTPP